MLTLPVVPSAYDPVSGSDSDDGDRIVMTYVPAHLYYMLFELYKVCIL